MIIQPQDWHCLGGTANILRVGRPKSWDSIPGRGKTP
jgi:hypothetical protein